MWEGRSRDTIDLKRKKFRYGKSQKKFLINTSFTSHPTYAGHMCGMKILSPVMPPDSTETKSSVADYLNDATDTLDGYKSLGNQTRGPRKEPWQAVDERTNPCWSIGVSRSLCSSKMSHKTAEALRNLSQMYSEDASVF